MSRTLAILSVTGLVLAALLLGLAHWIGGDDIFHDPRSLQGLRPLIDLATHKEWRWAGGDTLALDAPMTLRYQPQGRPNVTVTGPADAIGHVHFGAGRLTSDAPVPHNGDKLQAVVSGIPIHRFVVNGGENLQLGHIDQRDLAIHINGDGMVSGDGKVENLTLEISGAGQADLAGLSVGDANVSILGNGFARLSPHGALRLFMVGNGKLSLLTMPASIQRRLIGQPVIETPGDTAMKPPSVPPVAPNPPTGAGNPHIEQSPNPPAPPTPPSAPPLFPTQALPLPATRDSVMVRVNDSRNLGHIDQNRLNLTVAGHGVVRAEGRVDTLTVMLAGSGSVNLGQLSARIATVRLSGSGNITVAPSEEARVSIIGSGNVRLTTKPERIERYLLGTGHIIEQR